MAGRSPGRQAFHDPALIALGMSISAEYESALREARLNVVVEFERMTMDAGIIADEVEGRVGTSNVMAKIVEGFRAIRDGAKARYEAAYGVHPWDDYHTSDWASV